jgi:hypothetical protein
MSGLNWHGLMNGQSSHRIIPHSCDLPIPIPVYQCAQSQILGHLVCISNSTYTWQLGLKALVTKPFHVAAWEQNGSSQVRSSPESLHVTSAKCHNIRMGGNISISKRAVTFLPTSISCQTILWRSFFKIKPPCSDVQMPSEAWSRPRSFRRQFPQRDLPV